MSIGLRFYSMGKLTKESVSELLEIHLENTSELSFFLIIFSSEFKKNVFLQTNTLLFRKCISHVTFISIPCLHN